MRITKERIVLQKLCADLYLENIPKYDLYVIMFWLAARRNYLIYRDQRAFEQRREELNNFLDIDIENTKLVKAIGMITAALGKPVIREPRK